MKLRNWIFVLTVLLSTSCLKEHDYVPTEEDNNKLVNEWVYSIMYNYYYWNDQIPYKPNYTDNPNAFFKSLLYKEGEEDRFSWITENAQENYNMLHGVIESFGFEYILGYKDSLKQDLAGIVLYVSPNTPASNANIKRGDVFVMIDSTKITTSNYSELLDRKNALYTFQKETKERYNSILDATIIKENPVFYKSIIAIDNVKIGYLVYNMFTKDPGDSSKVYFNELLQVFSDFQSNSISELILDLRYNSGGLIDLAVTLSSLVVPFVDTSKVALKVAYNNKIMGSIQEVNSSTNMKFSDFPNSYIGNRLNRVYILTGHNTASSSEAVINILKAYMPITLIGTTTYGKNVGSMMFTDEYKRFTWAIQPIILKMYNSKGESDYTHGFVPDIFINEFNYPLKELGNTDETLLNKAILSITGKSSLKSYSIEKETPIVYNSLENKINLPLILKTHNVK